MYMISLYQQALDDLELRRAKCIEDLNKNQEDLAKLEMAITGLRAAMGITVNFKIQPSEASVGRIARPSDYDKRYANMSVRWAILKLLAEGGRIPSRPMKSADISDELTDGGNDKASKATVSAVISDMVKKRQELQRQEVEQSEDGGYQLTETGKHAWNAIKHSPKYANRASSIS
jgi:hypothetical protein